VSDFWQGAQGGLVINLDHVGGVDRPEPTGDLRIMTVVPGLTYSIKRGSPEESSFYSVINRQLASGAQLIVALDEIRKVLELQGR